MLETLWPLWVLLQNFCTKNFVGPDDLAVRLWPTLAVHIMPKVHTMPTVYSMYLQRNLTAATNQKLTTNLLVQGASQWIILTFDRVVAVRTVQIQFQGGFSATEVQLLGSNSESGQETSEEVRLEDSNKEQAIQLKQSIDCNRLRINLTSLSDDFGRVIIYKLDVLSD